MLAYFLLLEKCGKEMRSHAKKSMVLPKLKYFIQTVIQKKYRIEARKCNNPIFLIFIVYFVLNTTQTGLSAAISVPL